MRASISRLEHQGAPLISLTELSPLLFVWTITTEGSVLFLLM